MTTKASRDHGIEASDVRQGASLSPRVVGHYTKHAYVLHDLGVWAGGWMRNADPALLSKGPAKRDFQRRVR
jgi:hypothetical protein